MSYGYILSDNSLISWLIWLFWWFIDLSIGSVDGLIIAWSDWLIDSFSSSAWFWLSWNMRVLCRWAFIHLCIHTSMVPCTHLWQSFDIWFFCLLFCLFWGQVRNWNSMVITVIMLNLCLDISFCECGPVNIKDRHTCTKSTRIFSFFYLFFFFFLFFLSFFFCFCFLFFVLMMILTLHGVCKDIWPKKIIQKTCGKQYFCCMMI